MPTDIHFLLGFCLGFLAALAYLVYLAINAPLSTLDLIYKYLRYVLKRLGERGAVDAE